MHSYLTSEMTVLSKLVWGSETPETLESRRERKSEYSISPTKNITGNQNAIEGGVLLSYKNIAHTIYLGVLLI